MLKTRRLGSRVFRLGVFFFAYASLASNSGHTEDFPDWVKIGNPHEIEVFKKDIPGSPVVAFKGQGIVKAPIAKVAGILADTPRSVEWVDRMKEVKLLRKVSDSEYIEYTHIKTPPIIMKDRDFVIDHRLKVDLPKNSFIMSMESVTDLDAPETDYVRGQLLESSYTLRPMGKNQTYVIAEIHADPKGGVPKWVVNLFQKEWPDNTLQALREQAEKADIQENAFVSKLISKLKIPSGDEAVLAPESSKSN